MRFRVQTPARTEIWFEISVPLSPLANSAMMNTLAAHCQWEDESVRERTGHPPSPAMAKKMKSLTLHTHGCLRATFKGMIFFFLPLLTYMDFGTWCIYIRLWEKGFAELNRSAFFISNDLSLNNHHTGIILFSDVGTQSSTKLQKIIFFSYAIAL